MRDAGAWNNRGTRGHHRAGGDDRLRGPGRLDHSLGVNHRSAPFRNRKDTGGPLSFPGLPHHDRSADDAVGTGSAFPTTAVDARGGRRADRRTPGSGTATPRPGLGNASQKTTQQTGQQTIQPTEAPHSRVLFEVKSVISQGDRHHPAPRDLIPCRPAHPVACQLRRAIVLPGPREFKICRICGLGRERGGERSDKKPTETFRTPSETKNQPGRRADRLAAAPNIVHVFRVVVAIQRVPPFALRRMRPHARDCFGKGIAVSVVSAGKQRCDTSEIPSPAGPGLCGI